MPPTRKHLDCMIQTSPTWGDSRSVSDRFLRSCLTFFPFLKILMFFSERRFQDLQGFSHLLRHEKHRHWFTTCKKITPLTLVGRPGISFTAQNVKFTDYYVQTVFDSWLGWHRSSNRHPSLFFCCDRDFVFLTDWERTPQTSFRSCASSLFLSFSSWENCLDLVEQSR